MQIIPSKNKQPHNVDAGQAFSYTPLEFQTITAVEESGNITTNEELQGLFEYMEDDGATSEILTGADIDTLAQMVNINGQYEPSNILPITELRHANPYVEIEAIPFNSHTIYWNGGKALVDGWEAPALAVPNGAKYALITYSSIGSCLKVMQGNEPNPVTYNLITTMTNRISTVENNGPAIMVANNQSRRMKVEGGTNLSFHILYLSSSIGIAHIAFFK